MQWGLAGAFAAAFVYGVSAVLQSVAVRRLERRDALDPRLLLRLARQLPYDVAMGCETLGFALSLVALRDLPLFVVQAVVSASLAWTALFAWLFLGAALRARERAALAVVTAGLVLLAVSAGPDSAQDPGLLARSGLLAAVLALAAFSAYAVRGRASAPALGVLAGIAFSASGIGARVLANPTSPGELLIDPALYALCAGGVLGLLLNAQALQRGSVTLTTAAITATSTLVPAGVGLSLLDDHPRPHYGAVAAAGFLATLGGALLLTRLGTTPAPSVDPAAAALPELAGPSGEPCDGTA